MFNNRGPLRQTTISWIGNLKLEIEDRPDSENDLFRTVRMRTTVSFGSETGEGNLCSGLRGGVDIRG